MTSVCPLSPSACSRPSSVSICPHPYTPHTGVPERPGPQQSPTSLSHLGFCQKCPDPNCRVKKSLHGHHPRDCLFYLRDWTAVRLQKLLQVRHGQPGWVCRLPRRGGRAPGDKKGKALWAGIKENLTPIPLPRLRTITSCSTQSPQRGPGQSLEVSVRASVVEGERVAGRPLCSW